MRPDMDLYGLRHSVRVSEVVARVAARLCWPGEDVSALRIGAALHDVGKLAVSGAVLAKPGPLTPAELAQIRLHPAAGVRLLRPLGHSRPVLDCVLYHHERWDGCGYPSGRGAEAIPIAARLLAVADAFDAMTSTRPYRQPLVPEEALDELERCAGSQFDPALADAFVAACAEAYASGALPPATTWPRPRASSAFAGSPRP